MEEIEKLLERFERNIADNVRNALRGNFVVASKSIEKSDEIKSKLLSLYRTLQSDRDAALKKLEWAEEIVIGIGGFEKMDNTIPGRQARKYLDSKRQALKPLNPGNGR